MIVYQGLEERNEGQRYKKEDGRDMKRLKNFGSCRKGGKEEKDIRIQRQFKKYKEEEGDNTTDRKQSRGTSKSHPYLVALSSSGRHLAFGFRKSGFESCLYRITV